MIDFYIKRNDSLPVFTATLLDFQDNPVNLANSEVTFKYRPRVAASTFVTKAMDVLSSLSGIVRYSWAISGIDTISGGLYEGEIRANFADYSMTFPASSFLVFEIVDNIA